MKVVILCGGYGIRIRDVSEDLPKALIPIADRPILWHVMKYYAHFHHGDFVLCLGYKGQKIKEFFLNYEALTRDITLTLGSAKKIEFHGDQREADWRITLVETGLNAMTGARVRKIKKHLDPKEDFMLTYCDGIGDIDLDRLIRFHRSHGKILSVTGVRPPGRFGEMVSEQGGRVTEFNEKPQTEAGRISGGFFVCRPEIFDYLDGDDSLMFEQEPMQRLVKEGQMMVYEHNGFWHPMDTRREYQLLNSLFESGKAPWVVW